MANWRHMPPDHCQCVGGYAPLAMKCPLQQHRGGVCPWIAFYQEGRGSCGWALRNTDGWSGVLRRLVPTRSVTGRLWDDHFRDSGYPPTFYRGSRIQVSSMVPRVDSNSGPLTKKDIRKLAQNKLCFQTCCCVPCERAPGKAAPHRSPGWGCTKT